MNHLNFQNSFVSDKYQHDFYFCTKLWIPKNPCEHVWSCIVLEEKGNTPKDSWCYAFMLNGYAQWVICMKQQKWRCVMKTGKHMILFNKKGSFDRESLMKLWAKLPTKIGTGWNKNQEVLQAWSNWGGFLCFFFFFFFFCWTRKGSIMHRWCNSPSVSLPTKTFAETLDCVEAYWPMFASNFFRLSRCWVLNKDERSVGMNFPRVIFQYLLE